MKTLGEMIDKLISEMTPDFREDFEERAAIRQFDGNQKREEAEQAAMKEVRRKVDQDKGINK